MAVSKPQLPPKAGYVEIEENGQRVYKKVETETGQKLMELDQNKAEKTEVEAVWTELAAAYTEGVNSI